MRKYLFAVIVSECQSCFRKPSSSSREHESFRKIFESAFQKTGIKHESTCGCCKNF